MPGVQTGIQEEQSLDAFLKAFSLWYSRRPVRRLLWAQPSGLLTQGLLEIFLILRR